MDLVELHTRASRIADAFVKNVKSDQLDLQSTCSEWSVRDLLNHMVYENLWVPDILAGKTIEEVGDKYEGDVLGEDFLNAWTESNKKAIEAVQKPGALDQTVHLSYGDEPCEEYINQRILGQVIHGWDIAKSTGQDDALPEDIVKYLYDMSKPREKELRDSGLFGEKIDIPENADLKTKLLALLGRKR